MNREIEILAPAGSYESMRAAMNAGCDAVYMGGSRFGARAYADNPDEDTLLRAIEEAHLRNKKLYLTVNTLVKEEERLHLLYDYLEKYYLAGLDAVIVQDLGVMNFIHRNFPRLPIHASTQTTITMAQGVNYIKELGVTRLVTARELSFQEIKDIRGNTDLEIETFVHGALCYSYSGQCLMSSMIGGRSGNRGRCAQPCRMPYEFYWEGQMLSSDNKAYLLSPKDINTVALIPDLIEAGVSSFKIEGRMKRPEYAALVSYIYRKYVDLYLDRGKEAFYEFLKENEYKKDMMDLMDLYNRGGFSEGYGKTYHGKSMMSMVRPNHSGVLVGQVNGYDEGYANILLREDVNSQDILEIRNKEKMPVYEFTVKNDTPKKAILKTRVASIPFNNRYQNLNQNKKIKGHAKSLDISNGYTVYRTRNNALLNYIRKNYIDINAKKKIKGHLYVKQGEKLQLTLSYDNQSITAYHKVVEVAIKQPMTKERLQASIDKLGDTLFKFEELIIEADSNVFVPVAWLNEIRREAIAILSDTVIKSYHRSSKDLGTSSNSIGNSITKGNTKDKTRRNINVTIQNKEQFAVALSYSEVNAIYVDYDSFTLQELIQMSMDASRYNKEFHILLPYICRLKVYEKLNKDIDALLKYEEIDGFIIKNFEEAWLLESIFRMTGQYKKLRLNHNMYIFNKDTKLFWKNKGIHEFTAPVELNEKELKELGMQDLEMMVYGYLPIMVSAQCLHASTRSCNRCSKGTSRTEYMVDRIGKKFYLKTNCSSCYNIIYNGQRLSLLGLANKIKDLNPDGIRLDFTIETTKEMNMILSAYIDVFVYSKKAQLEFDNITRGHFKRGIL